MAKTQIPSSASVVKVAREEFSALVAQGGRVRKLADRVLMGVAEELEHRGETLDMGERLEVAGRLADIHSKLVKSMGELYRIVEEEGNVAGRGGATDVEETDSTIAELLGGRG